MEDGAASNVAATSVLARRQGIAMPLGAAAAAILIVALILRILGARGELWLDELWSLKLIDEVVARHDLFWGLAVDNNHYLNTLYLYLVGADAPALVQRALSILLGCITVLVAGIAMRREGIAATLSAMGLFAVAYPMVNYGSEARGYAGLILATLAGLLLTEAVATAQPSDRRRRATIALGAANAIGVLFQPVMLSGIVGMMGWTAWINRPADPTDWRGLRTTLATIGDRFSWTVRLLLPFAAIIAFSVLHADGYRIAGSVPFTAAGFVAGYGGLLRLLLGLPEAAPDWTALCIAAVALALACTLAHDGTRRGQHRRSLYLIFIVGLPAAMFVARLPNIYFPRYYLASGTVFLLLLADLFAWSWRRGNATRALAVVTILAIAAGNMAENAHLLRDGRDQSAAVMRLVASAGPTLVTSDQDVRDTPVVEFFARRLSLPVTYVKSSEICSRKPQWLVSSWSPAELGDTMETGDAGCRHVFHRVAAFPQWGLSGLPWSVYRAAP